MADIAQRTARMEPPQRPERMIELEAMGTVGDAARPLSFAERMLQITGVRRMIVVAVLCVAWQAYASYLNNSLLFPTLGETIDALYDALVSGPLRPACFFPLPAGWACEATSIETIPSRPIRSRTASARDQILAPPATQAYSARDPGAGAGLNGAPPTETGPIGLGIGEGFWCDVLTARARSFGCGIADVVTGVFCRVSARAASEES